MRHVTIAAAIVLAFAAGLVVSPMMGFSPRDAHSQTPPLTPMMIDLAALKHADLPTTPNPEMNAKGLVTTDNATVGIQSGNVAKHMHPKTDEIQYIVEGSGAMWLGSGREGCEPAPLSMIS